MATSHRPVGFISVVWSQAGVRYLPVSDCVDVTAESMLFIENCRPLA